MQFSQEVTEDISYQNKELNQEWGKKDHKKEERQRETVVCTRFRNNYQFALDKEDGGLQEECFQEKNAT